MPATTPLISVILPVYNAGEYIEESVKSVLAQTYGNFELIIINDGSKDNSEEIIRKIEDKRIRYYYQPNCGMAKTLNRGIDLANGALIARQDADDISLPERFEKQVDFLVKNSDTGLVGTWAEIIPAKNDVRRFHKHPAEDTQLKIDLFFNNPFVHSSVMMRRDILKRVGYYNVAKDSLIQDYDLWARFSRVTKIANLPEVLVCYREVSSGISQTTVNYSHKVIDQSIENVNFFYAGDSYAVTQLFGLYHGDDSSYDGNPSLDKMLTVLNELVSKVAQQTGNDVPSVKPKMGKHVRTLKYRYYTAKQEAAGKNILLKYWYKVLYRISIRMQPLT